MKELIACVDSRWSQELKIARQYQIFSEIKREINQPLKYKTISTRHICDGEMVRASIAWLASLHWRQRFKLLILVTYQD